MADITMCTDSNCERKHECYRQTATPNEFRQSYFMGTPLRVELNGKQVCDHFWKDVWGGMV